MLKAVWIGFAFVVGLFARSLGLPTVVGYLAAGFVIAAISPYLALPENDQGIIIAHSMHDDEAERIITAGADHAYLTMVEAGVGLAEHVKQRIEQRA